MRRDRVLELIERARQDAIVGRVPLMDVDTLGHVFDHVEQAARFVHHAAALDVLRFPRRAAHGLDRCNLCSRLGLARAFPSNLLVSGDPGTRRVNIGLIGSELRTRC